jgi:hypothetical protein
MLTVRLPAGSVLLLALGFAIICVCMSLLELLNQLMDFYETSHKHHVLGGNSNFFLFKSPIIRCVNMAAVRTCEVVESLYTESVFCLKIAVFWVVQPRRQQSSYSPP